MVLRGTEKGRLLQFLPNITSDVGSVIQTVQPSQNSTPLIAMLKSKCPEYHKVKPCILAAIILHHPHPLQVLLLGLSTI